MKGLKRWTIKNSVGWNVNWGRNEWKEVLSSEGLGTGRLKFACLGNGRGLRVENQAEGCKKSCEIG